MRFLSNSIFLLVLLIIVFSLNFCTDYNNILNANNKAPLGSILNPSQNSNYLEGDTISFSASITDPEDGDLTGKSLLWKSNIDGILGSGENLKVHNLSNNNHIISLTASDSYGGFSVYSVSLNVRHNILPTVSIDRSATNISYYSHEYVIFSGNAYDAEDGILIDSSIEWISDQDGFIGSGVKCSTNTLSGGKHTIFMKAIDYDNEISFDTISLVINVTFEKSFGGAGIYDGFSIKQSSENGYVIAGKTTSQGAGQSDAYVTKTDSRGNVIWGKTYGGSGKDIASSIANLSDGAYLIVGTTRSFGQGEEDIYIVKTNHDGDFLWQQTFGGLSKDYGNAFIEDGDGGYVTVGSKTNSLNGKADIIAIKTNMNGSVVWYRTFEWGGIDVCTSVSNTYDGGFILTGWTTSFGNGEVNAFIMKLNTHGRFVRRTIVGKVGKDVGTSVLQANDYGFIVAGWSSSIEGSDMYLVKVNSVGEVEWEKKYGGKGDDVASSICKSSDGGYVVAGYTSSFGAIGTDVYLIKVDAFGNLLWEKRYGGNGNDICHNVIETDDRGFALIGHTDSFDANNEDVYLIKTEPNGSNQWQKTYGGSDSEFVSVVQQTSDGGYIIGLCPNRS